MVENIKVFLVASAAKKIKVYYSALWILFLSFAEELMQSTHKYGFKLQSVTSVSSTVHGTWQGSLLYFWLNRLLPFEKPRINWFCRQNSVWKNTETGDVLSCEQCQVRKYEFVVVMLVVILQNFNWMDLNEFLSYFNYDKAFCILVTNN